MITQILDSMDNIMSFILGIFIVMLFWLSFKPKYVIIKNNKKQ
jgi:hypothetical protein